MERRHVLHLHGASALGRARRDFADWQTTWATLEKTGADPKLVLALRGLATDYFADEAAWQAFSPLGRVQHPPPPDAPDLYVSVGLYDAYGSYAGAERFTRDARERGWRVDWRPLYGGHCAVDVESVAWALLPLAARPPAPGD